MRDIFHKLQTSNRRFDRSKQRIACYEKLSKFKLNPSVNESGKSILLQLRRSKINIVAQRSSTLPEYEKRRETTQFDESLNP